MLGNRCQAEVGTRHIEQHQVLHQERPVSLNETRVALGHAVLTTSDHDIDTESKA